MPPRRNNHKHLPPNVYLKHGAYYYVQKSQDKRLWHRLGKTLGEALTAYAKLIDKPKNIITMNDLFDRYIVEVISGQNYAKNKINIINNLRKVFGCCYPDEIYPKDIYRYMDERSKEVKESSKGKYSGLVTANREKEILSHAYTMAIRWGIVDKNPCSLVESNKEQSRDRYIDTEEFLAVYKIASNFIKLAMQFAYLTGQRRGDIISLKWSQVTDEGVLISQSKTNKNLIIEWSEELKECISDIRKIRTTQSEYVFCNEAGKMYTGSGFSALWQKTIKKALEIGVIKESFTFHDIRAKSATDTICEQEASNRLGHSNIATTRKVYLRKATKVKPLK